MDTKETVMRDALNEIAKLAEHNLEWDATDIAAALGRARGIALRALDAVNEIEYQESKRRL